MTVKLISLHAATTSAIKFLHNLCTCGHLTLHNEAECNQARLDDLDLQSCSLNCKNVNAISELWMSFHFLSNCFRQHPNTFGSLTSSPSARESSRCVQHFQSLLLVEGPALSPWYPCRWENGCLRAKHNHHLFAISYQIKSAMLFCVGPFRWLPRLVSLQSLSYDCIIFEWPRKSERTKYTRNVLLHSVQWYLVLISSSRFLKYF